MPFVRSNTHTLTFDGQQIVAVVKPIEYGDYIALQSQPLDIARMGTVGGDAVRKYVTFERSPVAADGTPVTIDEVCTHPFFAVLMGELYKFVIKTGDVADPKAFGGKSRSGSKPT